MTAATLDGPRPARARVLQTATRLFYAEGVHAVGIDRIIAEAEVAKATFYHHFRSKDDLVAAYLTEQSAWQRAAVAMLPTAPARQTLQTIFTYLCDFGARPDYRGCPFINAAAEYPDPGHPVREAIAEHRRWLRGLLRDLLAADGHPDAERYAGILLALRDGLSIGLNLDDPATVRGTVQETLARLFPDAAATVGTPAASGAVGPRTRRHANR